MTVQLGCTPDGRWDIDTAGLAAVARDAGLSTLGTSMKRADKAAFDAYEQAGIRCHEIMSLTFTPDHERVLGYAEKMVQAAETMHSDWVSATFMVPLDDRLAPLVERCAAMFAEVCNGMAAEFSPLGAVNTLDDALEIVEVAGRDRAGLLVDTWHFSRGDSTWEMLEKVPVEQIAFVQFDDALPVVSDDGMEETMNRRTLPGQGEFDVERFATTILEKGYEGVVSAEILSAELNQLPVTELLPKIQQSMARYWR